MCCIAVFCALVLYFVACFGYDAPCFFVWYCVSELRAIVGAEVYATMPCFALLHVCCAIFILYAVVLLCCAVVLDLYLYRAPYMTCCCPVTSYRSCSWYEASWFCDMWRGSFLSYDVLSCRALVLYNCNIKCTYWSISKWFNGLFSKYINNI